MPWSNQLPSVNAINDRGIAVGQSMASVVKNGEVISGGDFAAEWQSAVATSLGSLQDSGTSDAYGINNSGDIVGSSDTTQAGTAADPGAFSHAFLYRHGLMADLGTPDGDADSSAFSINDRGQIVGASMTQAALGRAFLYQKGQVYDLNSLIDRASPLVGLTKLQLAVSIRSNGWIAVNGTDTRDQLGHASLLTEAVQIY